MELRANFCYSRPMRFPFPLTCIAILSALVMQPHAMANELDDDYASIHETAVDLAGAPGDITQRAQVLLEIFEDSGRNDPFPAVALHGALWARGFFPSRATLAALSFLLHPAHTDHAVLQFAELDQFETSFKMANRQVFIDTYTNYYFSKIHGDEEDAVRFIQADLLAALNKVHHAVDNDEPLSIDERREVFETCLLNEQEKTVGPTVLAAVAQFHNQFLLSFALQPFVHFKYFPSTEIFHFQNFSDVNERILYAKKAYEIAETVGWDAVVDAIDAYGP
jgi:hypothetical protein